MKRFAWLFVLCFAVLLGFTLAASIIRQGFITTTVSGSGSITFVPPYLYDGTNYYVASTGYTASKPSSSPTWINSVAPSVSAAAGVNGDYVAVTGGGPSWQTQTCTASVEAEFTGVSQTGSSNSIDTGVWVYDSTNSIIWSWESAINGGGQYSVVQVNKWSYSGSGNPSYSSTPTKYGQIAFQGIAHYKLVASGGTLSFQVSLNGGQTFITLTTQSVGTLSQCGYLVGGSGSGNAGIDVYSEVVN